MAYESPIRLITELENKIIEDQREGIYKAVLSYQIDIGKDELFKLLYGDRKQYEKGFADGRADATKHGRWIENIEEVQGLRWIVNRCSCCNSARPMRLVDEPLEFNYCPNCGARMDEVEE